MGKVKDKKKTHIYINKNNLSVKKKVIQNKKDSFSNFKFYLIVFCIIFSIISLIFIPKYLHNELYGKLFFYGFLIISLIIIFTDKIIIKRIKLFISYVKDSTSELSKVVWSDKKTAMTMTIMVIIFVILLSLFIWGVDSLVSWLFYDILLKR